MRDLLLLVHVVSGFSALGAAFIATFSKSFNAPHSWHVYSGRVFFGGMAGIFVSALALSLMTENIFLLLIAIFSFYLASAGWAYARKRQGRPRRLDWIRSGGMLLAAFVMAAYGVFLLVSNSSGAIVLLAFSLIAGWMSYSDIRRLRAGGLKGRDRIRAHVTMMLAGAIATITAFLVVNVQFRPALVLWLAPTLVVTPYIVYWNRKLQRGAVPKGMPKS